MILRESEHKGTANFDMILNLAKKAKGKDEEGYRTEFVSLVETASLLNE